MGSWNVSVTGDDTVLDIVSTYTQTLKTTQSFDLAKEQVLKEYCTLLDDEDEMHLVWLALGQAQWKYDKVETNVLSQVSDIIANGIGLELFAEQGTKCLSERKRALNEFQEKIKKPNPKPNKVPRIKRAKILFESGDCLSIQRQNGEYLAGIVIWTDKQDVEHPLYIISILDWCGLEPPDEKVFKSNKVLKVEDTFLAGEREATMGYINYRFNKFKERFNVITNLSDKIEENAESRFVSHWELIDEDYEYSKNGI